MAAGEWQRQGRSFQVLVAATWRGLRASRSCTPPPFYDSCALVVVEGMAGGRPVITSRYNGASEMLRHGIDGFVLQEPAHTAEFAGVLEKLFDPKLREQISTAAIATARTVCLQNPANDIVAAVEDLARTL